MQVENKIDKSPEPVQAENSSSKLEPPGSQNKQSRAETRIARYQQKPQRKASKMLVRLLQWADKLVIKFFTKNYLPQELEIFFNREARANKVELKKAQIDYSVEDFAVRLYVFWVCQNYFTKGQYQENLERLLSELLEELSRKRNNLFESLTLCEQQTQKRQKEEELKWMGAIINGLKKFKDHFQEINESNAIMQFLEEITTGIMIDCLRKPGNKLAKKKEKLSTKIKYFEEKIREILDNPNKSESVPRQKVPKIPPGKSMQVNTIIIKADGNSFQNLKRSVSNGSAFSNYTGGDRKPSKKASVNSLKDSHDMNAMSGFIGSCQLVKRIKEVQSGECDKIDLKKLVKEQENLFESSFPKKESPSKSQSQNQVGEGSKHVQKVDLPTLTLNIDVSSQKESAKRQGQIQTEKPSQAGNMKSEKSNGAQKIEQEDDLEEEKAAKQQGCSIKEEGTSEVKQGSGKEQVNNQAKNKQLSGLQRSHSFQNENMTNGNIEGKKQVNG